VQDALESKCAAMTNLGTYDVSKYCGPKVVGKLQDFN